LAAFSNWQLSKMDEKAGKTPKLGNTEKLGSDSFKNFKHVLSSKEAPTVKSNK
jgi:hypothetical protein